MSSFDSGSPGRLGAIPSTAGTRFLVWAPRCQKVEVAYEGSGPRSRMFLLERRGGYFYGMDPAGQVGDLYRYRLDGEKCLPDPFSREQPEGIDGPSLVVEPSDFKWSTPAWQRPSATGRVIYELHVGTFTGPGTLAAAAELLEYIASLGVNTVELMPVHQFGGRRSWGYDGVLLSAPANVYGRPDDLRAFVDAAHGHGLAVVLDVVYNHLGSSGNVLPAYSDDYFHREGVTTWGTALNFDGPSSPEVRRFFLENVALWLDEYRFDGLRLDATHAIQDTSTRHILSEIATVAHERGAFVMAEDDRNEARLLRSLEENGYGLDAVWADDFHHSIKVSTTGISEGYFRAFDGSMGEIVRTLSDGWLYSGQISPPTGQPRGSTTQGLAAASFVHCISNHDQVGNRALGERLNHVIPAPLYRAVSLLLCLTPYTPLLFMGQEWAAGTPFLYFSDHSGELGKKIADYRRAEFRQHGINLGAHVLDRMPDPQADSTFLDSKLQWSERDQTAHQATLDLYRRSLRLRSEQKIFQNPPRDSWSVRRLGSGALALRWREETGDWLLVVFMVCDSPIAPEAEAYTRPGKGQTWELVLSSADVADGQGVASLAVLESGTLPCARLYHEVSMRS